MMGLSKKENLDEELDMPAENYLKEIDCMDAEICLQPESPEDQTEESDHDDEQLTEAMVATSGAVKKYYGHGQLSRYIPA